MTPDPPQLLQLFATDKNILKYIYVIQKKAQKKERIEYGGKTEQSKADNKTF